MTNYPCYGIFKVLTTHVTQIVNTGYNSKNKVSPYLVTYSSITYLRRFEFFNSTFHFLFKCTVYLFSILNLQKNNPKYESDLILR